MCRLFMFELAWLHRIPGTLDDAIPRRVGTVTTAGMGWLDGSRREGIQHMWIQLDEGLSMRPRGVGAKWIDEVQGTYAGSRIGGWFRPMCDATSQPISARSLGTGRIANSEERMQQDVVGCKPFVAKRARDNQILILSE